MAGLSKSLAWLKFRFDLGSIFIVLANFVMLVIMVSEKAVTFFSLTMPHAQMWVALIAVPLAFVATLAFGEVLIRMRYFEHYLTENNKRNPIYEELIKEIRSMKK